MNVFNLTRYLIKIHGAATSCFVASVDFPLAAEFPVDDLAI
jgi:hypothetical protein